MHSVLFNARRRWLPVIVAIGVLGIPAAHAQVIVEHAWVRATAGALKDTGAFMDLQSTSPAKLVKAESPAAAHVELHESAVADNMMTMRAVPAIEVPAGKMVELKPGGYHVMLIGVKHPLKEGDAVPLTLVFDVGGRQESVKLNVPVRALNAEMKMPMK